MAAGDRLFSAAGYALAGPSETTEISIGRIMRTVDATAPFETTLAEANLAVRLSDAPDPVKQNANLTYTIAVTNLGPSGATGVNVVDNLPASVSFRSVSASQGSCTRSGQQVRCNLGDLPSGGWATVTIVVRPTQKGTVSNTASVSSSGPADHDPSNDSSTTTTVVGL
jgi:uncharacterized repeat protein (TIGR01451 family)